MSPLAPSQRKRIPLLAAGAATALVFAAWNVHRALEPPLRNIPKGDSLGRVSAEVERALPLPAGEETPSAADPMAPAPKTSAIRQVAEENLSPDANPFVPLPGGGQAGEQFVTAATPRYEAMAQLPPPAYIPASPTLMRLATSMVTTPPKRDRRAGRPVVSIRSAQAQAEMPSAPVLPTVPPALAAPVAVQPAPARPEAPPSLTGTLLGDQPSAVFLVDGNLTIVPAGGIVGGWQVLTVSHGQVMLKHLTTGMKVPVVAAAELSATGK